MKEKEPFSLDKEGQNGPYRVYRHNFVIVDDFCKNYAQARKLHSRGFLPKLTDSEVITMEIAGECRGYHKNKGIY